MWFGPNDIEAPKALDMCLELESEANENLAAIFRSVRNLAAEKVSGASISLFGPIKLQFTAS